MFEGLRHIGHHYMEARAVADLPPDATLRMTPAQIAAATPPTGESSSALELPAVQVTAVRTLRTGDIDLRATMKPIGIYPRDPTTRWTANSFAKAVLTPAGPGTMRLSWDLPERTTAEAWGPGPTGSSIGHRTGSGSTTISTASTRRCIRRSRIGPGDIRVSVSLPRA